MNTHMNGTQGILASLVLLVNSSPAEPGVVENHGKDCVVLLHGLGRTACSMKRLEWSLQKEDYRVINASYASTRLSVQDAAGWLDGVLKKRTSTSDPVGKIHFVTHSFGGIVLRQYLADRKIENLGRVVMLCPPNRGSELADKLRGNAFYKFFTGPGGQQLGTEASSVPRRLGRADYELGIIAGDRSLNPIFSAWIPGPDDGKVSVASTQLEGMQDSLVIHHSHTWMPWRKDVTIAVSQFLKCGRFKQNDLLRSGSHLF